MVTNPVKIQRLVLRGLAVLALVSVGVLPSASAQDIDVTSADPPEAEQATVNLDVTIHGNGFAKGAVAEFLVTGSIENPGGIIVNRTTFKGSKKLIANIDIEEDAIVGGFDIEVTTKGRTGKGIDLFSVKVTSKNPPNVSLAAADFRDAGTDGVKSDGYVFYDSCGEFNSSAYVDVNDPCGPSVSTVSKAGFGYSLRTVSNLDPQTVDRWLVLDFSEPYGDYQCPDLDALLMYEVMNSPNPGVLPPLNTDENTECVDFVEVRLVADGAFQPQVSTTTVNMLIDTPVFHAGWGKGKRAQSYTIWDARFILNSVNPLSLTYGPSGEAIVGADSIDDFRFELWTFDQRKGTFGDFIGIYTMPFQLTITKRE